MQARLLYWLRWALVLPLGLAAYLAVGLFNRLLAPGASVIWLDLVSGGLGGYFSAMVGGKTAPSHPFLAGAILLAAHTGLIGFGVGKIVYSNLEGSAVYYSICTIVRLVGLTVACHELYQESLSADAIIHRSAAKTNRVIEEPSTGL